MLYPSVNEIRTKADSRYTLVILAAKRAREVIDGVPKLTEEEVIQNCWEAQKNQPHPRFKEFIL